MKSKRRVAALGALAVSFGLIVPSVALPAYADDPVDKALATELGLVPLPAELAQVAGEAWELTAETKIVANGDAVAIGELFAEQARKATGYDLPVVQGLPGAGDISLQIDTARTFGVLDADDFYGDNEAYALDVAASGVTVVGGSAHGLFNGVQTLRQLFPAWIESAVPVNADWTIPALRAADGPRFAWRATMMDSARSFKTVADIKRVIGTISQYKMSALHLHLADDQGWRIEITNDGKELGDPIDYSLLTSVGGATAMTQQGYNSEPGVTGYYSQEDFREIVQYAADHFVTVVPEIDLPGHTNSILHSIPELNTLGSSWRDYLNTPSRWDPAGVTPVEAQSTVNHNGTGSVGYSYLDPDLPLTYTFIRHVLTQIRDMNPDGPYLGTGGDEVASFTSRYGMVKFGQTVENILAIVHDLGKKAFGWSEIADGDLQAGDAVQYWNPSASVVNLRDQLANNGAKVVMSYGAAGYIDMKYWGRNPIGLTWACNPGNNWASGNTGCDFPNYYNWNPVLPPYTSSNPDRIFNPPLEEDEILGVEPPLWSETLRSIDQVEFLAYPRLLSYAEMGWTPQALREVQDFTNRIQVIGESLTIGGINFADNQPKNTSSLTTDFSAGWQYTLATVDGVAEVDQAKEITLGYLAAPGTNLSTDGTTLTQAVEVYNTALPLDQRAIMRSVSAITPKAGGALSYQVDWGDGSPAEPALLSTDQPRDTIHAAGLYTIKATHTYTQGGTYIVSLTGTDGSVSLFSIETGVDEDIIVGVNPGVLALTVPNNQVIDLGDITLNGLDQYVGGYLNTAHVT
ncbi:MAG: family 20 glycosylhydrolase, partial [Bifidobacteriaceae bacterium]|nr:family 20 glycosylhydrolase [Bifidobacteriaceae bacterium]